MPARRGSPTPSYDEPSSSDGDQDFLDSLTRKQVLEINEAFDTAANGGQSSISISSKHSNQPANKRRRLDKGKGKAVSKEPEQAPGGFFVGGDDDDDGPSAGGFMKDTGSSGGGGFLIGDEDDDEDDASAGGGGFLPASRSTARSQPGSSSKPSKAGDKPNSVLLDQIPSILESLGLDGDDNSLLSIFENASFADPAQDGLQAVKRKDFFKVAAILITQRDNERAEHLAHSRSTSSKSRKGKEKAGTFVSSGGGKGRAVNIDADEVQDADEHDDSDPLILDSDDEDDEEDDFNRDNEDSDPWADEDEVDGAFTGDGRGSSPASKRRTTRSRAKETSPLSSLPSDDDVGASTKAKKGKGKAKSSSKASDEGKYKLSSRQREECNKMFHQFFTSSDKSRNKAITMAEIRYVATLLNEKISDEDVSANLECPLALR